MTTGNKISGSKAKLMSRYTFKLYSTASISQFWMDRSKSLGIFMAHLTSFSVLALMLLSDIFTMVLPSCLVLPLARYTMSWTKLNLGVISLDELLLTFATIIAVSPGEKAPLSIVASRRTFPELKRPISLFVEPTFCISRD